MFKVKSSAQLLETAVAKLVTQTDSTLTMYDDQSERTNSVASAINQFSATATEISSSASNASTLAKDADQYCAKNQQTLTTTYQAFINFRKYRASARNN